MNTIALRIWPTVSMESFSESSAFGKIQEPLEKNVLKLIYFNP